jgi:hypothetical protein
MNDQTRLLHRLLRLYPIKVVKEFFNITGNSQTAVIEDVINSNTPRSIKIFALEHFNHTKQHIYIYALDSGYSVRRFNQDELPFDIIHETHLNSIRSFYSLPKVKFSVVLSNPVTEEEIHFYQPTCISFSGSYLIIQVTIMEKKIDTYFDPGRKLYEVNKLVDENDNIKEILEYLSNSYMVEVADLNRGIKLLWENDLIDSKHVKYKKSRSTATEAMDENYTLKTQYPEVYNDLVNSPLNRTVFKYLIDDELMCDHFSIDPINGQLSIPLYPGNNNQIWNVINEILANN